MGSLNEFVDANIATLQMLMHEKRKLQMLIEEGKMAHSTVCQERDNFETQLALLN